MIKFPHNRQSEILNGQARAAGHATTRMPHQLLQRRVTRRIGPAMLALLILIWGLDIILVERFCQCGARAAYSLPDALNVLDAGPDKHEEVILAGFGFQGPASSSITIRTYERRTGTVLAEESYDLSVMDEGTSTDTKHARIFAGGIGLDREGRSRFLLRVYDALDGRFLWEGQLNLVPRDGERRTRSIATVVSSRSAAWRTGMVDRTPVDVQFLLRAVDPRTRRLMWERLFVPGATMTGRVERIAFPLRSGQIDTIRHIFDLVLRVFDRESGRLLWEDSFADAAAGTQIDREEGRLLEPGGMPFWNRDRRVRRLCFRFRRFQNVMNVIGGVSNENLQPIAVGICRR